MNACPASRSRNEKKSGKVRNDAIHGSHVIGNRPKKRMIAERLTSQRARLDGTTSLFNRIILQEL